MTSSLNMRPTSIRSRHRMAGGQDKQEPACCNPSGSPLPSPVRSSCRSVASSHRCVSGKSGCALGSELADKRDTPRVVDLQRRLTEGPARCWSTCASPRIHCATWSSARHDQRAARRSGRAHRRSRPRTGGWSFCCARLILTIPSWRGGRPPARPSAGVGRCVLDQPDRRALARPAGGVRQLEFDLAAVPPLVLSGVWDVLLQGLADSGGELDALQMIDSTTIRAHRCAAGETGGMQFQALGRSRGGFTTKVHLRCNAVGLPVGVVLTTGEAHDVTAYDALMQQRDKRSWRDVGGQGL